MKKKINWLLILQAWSMLLVIIGHAPLQPYRYVGWVNNPQYVAVLYELAQPFRMALFMMISGYLFYLTRLSKDNWSYGKILKDKFIRLGIPFLTFTFLAMVVKTLFSSYMERPADTNMQYFFSALIYPQKGPLGEMWFIMAIMWCFCLTPLWKFVLKNRTYIFAILFLFVILYFVPFKLDVFRKGYDVLCIGEVCHRIIWFYLGLLICKYDLFNKFKPHFFYIMLVGVFVYVISYLFNFSFTKEMGHFVVDIDLSFTMAIGGIMFSVGLAFLLDTYLPKAFSTFRNYTYQIFLLGMFAQVVVKLIYRHSHLPYLPMFILCIAIGLYAPVIISTAFKKINFTPLLYCIGLKPISKFKEINKN